MTAGWIFVGGGIVVFAGTATVAVRRWAPRKWGSGERYASFALMLAALSVALVSEGITQLTLDGWPATSSPCSASWVGRSSW